MSEINLLRALSDNIKIDMQKCVFCGECVERCILDNLLMRLAPCRQACPLGVNAQAYAQLIARGKEDQAREMIQKDLPFPGIIGRICEAPCEANCHRGKTTGQPVAIRALKRYLFEKVPAAPPKMAPATGRKVAVVGAGPAGLLAACDLAVKGHAVSLLDAAARPGGLLRAAIPPFRLPEEVVSQELGLLDKLGVRFSGGVRVTSQEDLAGLEAKFEAVVLAVGLGGDRRLGIEGEELAGVHPALELLRASREGSAPALSGRVVVIGGGNSAVDAAQTALRLGARQVTVVSLEKRGQMPAFASAVAEAEAEGVAFLDTWGPVRLVGGEGRVRKVELRRCLEVLDATGAFRPRFNDCETASLEAEAVIVAIGQAGGALGRGELAKLAADPLTLQTQRPKVFLAGDCQSGPGSVIKAMAAGRRAAESVDRLLRGEDLRFGRAYRGPVLTDFPIDLSGAVTRDRVKPPVHKLTKAGDFAELEKAYPGQDARREAERCYSCGRPEGYHRTCWFCLPCEVSCPEEALWVDIPYLLR